MPLVSSRRPSGGQSSGAAAAYLMASAFALDDDRGGGGISRSNTADDDESVLFPTTGSLVSSVAPSPKSLRGTGIGLSSSPRGGGGGGGRGYTGPYMYDLRAGGGFGVDASFDSECGSTFTAGPSASVAGSFGYGAGTSPGRRNRGERRPREMDDDLVSDLTTLSAPVQVIRSGNDAVAAQNPHKTKKGRGRGAMKSFSRSLRSRSPSFKGGKNQFSDEHDAVSVDGGSLKSARSSRSTRSASAVEGRRRSRTRSPLRKVADSIGAGLKKTATKGRRRSRSAGGEVELRLGAASSENYAGRADKLKSSSTRSFASSSSVDPAEYSGDEDSISIYSVSSMGSYSTAPCSVGATSVSSAPVLWSRSHRRTNSGGSAIGMRRVVSSQSLLPTLILEDECDDPSPLDATSVLGDDYEDEEDPIIKGSFDFGDVPLPQDEARQDSENVVKSVERSTRRSLLKRAKSGKKISFRVGRSRSRSRGAKRRNKDCDDSISVMSDVSAPGRIQGHGAAFAQQHSKIEVGTPPSKVLQASRKAPTPTGLSRRMSTDNIVARLNAGSGAADAVRRLREQQAGLTVSSPSLLGGGSQKLNYLSIAGIPVPDYAAYVEGAVGALRQSMGVSDEDYAAAKGGLLSWVYYGTEV